MSPFLNRNQSTPRLPRFRPRHAAVIPSQGVPDVLAHGAAAAGADCPRLGMGDCAWSTDRAAPTNAAAERLETSVGQSSGRDWRSGAIRQRLPTLLTAEAGGAGYLPDVLGLGQLLTGRASQAADETRVRAPRGPTLMSRHPPQLLRLLQLVRGGRHVSLIHISEPT